MGDLFIYFDQLYRIGEAARAELGGIVRSERFERNAYVQQPGNSCRTVYFIMQGAARVFYYKDGIDITEHFAFGGQVIVRAESLFTGKPTPKGIQVLEDTEMASVNAANLFALYDVHHDIERLFRLIFEREYVAALRRVESFQFRSATERYLELLNETELVAKIPLKHIASYLGITQVSLSRIRASLG
jgi:CRP-like cAMP-binding protein